VRAWGRHLAALSAVVVLVAAAWAIRAHVRTSDVRAGNGQESVVKIDWAEGVGMRARWRLEREFGLMFAQSDAGRWWTYHLPDAAPKTLELLVAHPRVTRTGQIDRVNYQPEVVVQDDRAAVVPRHARSPTRSRGRHARC
jgi:hypothetical protein